MHNATDRGRKSMEKKERIKEERGGRKKTGLQKLS